MADTTDITAFYQNLLLYQWKNQPKASATVGMLADLAICDLVIQDIQQAFDIDTAVGPQLDVIGAYVGFNREIYGTLARLYFELDTYSGPHATVGMTEYSDPAVNMNSVFYQYGFSNQAKYALQDAEYRQCIKLQLALNYCGNTLGEIQQLLWNSFGSELYLYDNQDMTFSYYVIANPSAFTLLALTALSPTTNLQLLLPKPCGVGVTGIYQVANPLIIFGFTRYATPALNPTGLSRYGAGWSGEVNLRYADRFTP